MLALKTCHHENQGQKIKVIFEVAKFKGIMGGFSV